VLRLGPQYRCTNLRRAELVRDSALNGIDFLEVLDHDLAEGSALRQRVLLVHLFKPVPVSPITSTLHGVNVLIRGGVRIVDPGVLWAVPARPLADGQVPTTSTPGTPNFDAVPADEQAELRPLLNDTEQFTTDDLDHMLVVRTDLSGDFSRYELSLVDLGTNDRGENLPLPGFDEPLSRVAFSFKVECPTEFDCATDTVCPPETATVPAIDYLAKDYDSFRTLMLDRLALTMPDWTERHEADVGVMVVEILAYAADQLSYFQDAVSNETYLGTARRRASMRRHARLLDYFPREGSNARTFVHLDLDGASRVLPAHTRLCTRRPDVTTAAVNDETFQRALSAGALAFETMTDVHLVAAHNTINFHTWGDQDCCLPKGATRATLADPDEDLELQPGDLLAFVEIRGADDGSTPEDADPQHRHVVRLTRADQAFDPLFDGPSGSPPLRVLRIEWAQEDALPFSLCLRGAPDNPVSVARGNIVLADAGVSFDEALPTPPDTGLFRPRLSRAPVTFQGQVTTASGQTLPFDPAASAASALVWDARGVRPEIILFPEAEAGPTACDPGTAHSEVWEPRRDLLESGAFSTDFVVETDNDGTAELRFGDDTFGRRPDVALHACYRVGNGIQGNIGADALAHVLTDLPITSVSNPLPGTGGAEPESLDEVRISAPQAFRVQERAVTEADYAEVALRHPEIQRAIANRRFTGSWYTMFVTVDRLGGLPVDDAFKTEFAAFLDRFRLAGYDLEIEGAIFVPLDIELQVCVDKDFFRENVKRAVLDALSARDLPNGQRGFFHPDNFTFGDPVFLSRLVAAVLAVPGVTGVHPTRFKRLDEQIGTELEDGVLPMKRLEIAQLDNDPSQPEHGQLQLVMQGGA